MLTAKDFSNESEIRWCPGCGDISILKQLQMALAKSGSIPHQTAIISGIGCSSRLPYYMNTYGFHTIHGRAAAVATGMKTVQSEMEVWIVTGDGDMLSIGTNHFIHLFRRNIDVNVLMFNNKIYGLTKGQYSPTSAAGQISKSSPYGNVEHPLNPISLCIAAKASFVARTLDKDASHLQQMIIASKSNIGASFIEIYQNCPIFNDGIHDVYTNRVSQNESVIRLEEEKPLLFGENNEKAIIIEGLKPKIVQRDQVDSNLIWVHDSSDLQKANIIAEFNIGEYPEMPLPIGIIYNQSRNIANYNDPDKAHTFQLFANEFDRGSYSL